MPEIIPFRCFYYKEGKDENKLKNLVAPPYDVISEEEIIEFKKRDPNNICHVILPDSYGAAGQKLNEMIDNNILITEKSEYLFIYGIDFKRPDTGESVSRYGIVGLLKLVDIFPANDGVIPHEAVFRDVISDRYRLIRKTDSNESPLFMIYNGNGSVEKILKKYLPKKPFLQTVDRDNFLHKIWEIKDVNDIKAIQTIIKHNSVIIADGHHRYITCLRYSKRGGCKYVMALFIDFNDPGLLIFTNHRQVHNLSVNNLEEFKERLEQYFDVQDVKNLENLKKILSENKDNHVFGCYFQDTHMIIKLKDGVRPDKIIPGNHSKEWKNLNLPILHHMLFKICLNVEEGDVSYIKEISRGVENVNKGIIKALFIVNYTSLEEVHKITHLGEIMPHKSTYFYPKPLSGLIIHKHTVQIE